MTTSNAIAALLEMCQQRVEAATGVVAQCLSRHQQSLVKLEQVQAYRRDYEQQMSRSGAAGMDAMSLCNFRAFLARLDAAIEQQQREVAHWATQLQAAQQELFDEQRREKSFEVIEQRRTISREREQQILQQKQSDEFAARASRVVKR